MKKVFALLFVASMFTFASCTKTAETAGEEATANMEAATDALEDATASVDSTANALVDSTTAAM